jgi:hypothetical protein
MDLELEAPLAFYVPTTGYRLWCRHLRSIGLRPRPSRKYNFAKSQWKLYWEGVRDARLSDAAVYLIDKYGY